MIGTGTNTKKRNGRPRKYPEGYKEHIKAVRAEKRAQLAAQAATVATVSQSLGVITPQTGQKPQLTTVRPLPPSLQALSPYPTSEEVEKMVVEGGFDLTELGTPCAHATGILSALLELMTHKAAFEATGTRWSVLHMFCAWCSDFDRLYRVALRKLDEKRVQVLRDEAFEWACSQKSKGVYHNGKRIDTEAVHSDKMHDLLLRGLDPETFGKASEDGQSQAVQVNITL